MDGWAAVWKEVVSQRGPGMAGCHRSGDRGRGGKRGRQGDTAVGRGIIVGGTAGESKARSEWWSRRYRGLLVGLGRGISKGQSAEGAWVKLVGGEVKRK